jgi:hypothetical protein
VCGFFSFQETISLNAAIFGSVLLASRLHSSFLVFTFILFAFELFAGFPMITRGLRVSKIVEFERGEVVCFVCACECV